MTRLAQLRRQIKSPRRMPTKLTYASILILLHSFRTGQANAYYQGADDDEDMDLDDSDDVADESIQTTSSASAPASTPAVSGSQPQPGSSVGDWFIKRAQFIPLRLTFSERKFLRLLEAALQVSEYTDKIDTIVYGSKVKRIVAQIRELCAILSGLVLAADYKQVSRYFSTSLWKMVTDVLVTPSRAKNSSRIVILNQTRTSTNESLNWAADIRS